MNDTPQQEVVLRSQEDVLAYRATLVGNHLYGIKELWHALRLVDDHPRGSLVNEVGRTCHHALVSGTVLEIHVCVVGKEAPDER